jgi:hypothetical protein
VGLAIALFCLPVLVDLIVHSRRVFGYLAPDAFYYLTVARNHWQTGQWSFDGEHRTNGYHPLWQWLLSLLYGLVHELGGDEVLLLIVVIVGVVLIAAALLLLGRALHRARRLSPLFVLVVPGFIALVSTPLYQPDAEYSWPPLAGDLRPIATTLWSYANGMETPILLFLFAACVLWSVSRPQLATRAQAIGLGLLLLLLTFARLDHGLFAIAVLGSVWRDDKPAPHRHARVTCGVFALGISIYLISNQWIYNAPIPVSGVHKSSFPSISTDALSHLSDVLVDRQSRWLGTKMRLTQLLLPPVCALLYLLLQFVLRTDRGRTEALLCWMAVAVLALGAYNTLFVPLSFMGTWYFPLSALFVSLAAITSLDRIALLRRIWASPKGSIVALTLLAVAVTAYFFRAHHRPGYMQEQATFYYDEAPKIRAYYGQQQPKIIEFDDGIVTFATGFPAMSGFSVLLDSEALAAKDEGGLLQVAIGRGYARVASSYYARFRQSEVLHGGHAYQVYDRWIAPQELHDFLFIPEYHSPESGVAIFRIVRVSSKGARITRGQPISD